MKLSAKKKSKSSKMLAWEWTIVTPMSVYDFERNFQLQTACVYNFKNKRMNALFILYRSSCGWHSFQNVVYFSNICLNVVYDVSGLNQGFHIAMRLLSAHNLRFHKNNYLSRRTQFSISLSLCVCVFVCLLHPLVHLFRESIIQCVYIWIDHFLAINKYYDLNFYNRI